MGCAVSTHADAGTEEGRFPGGILDLQRVPSTAHGHDFHHGLSKVVMVRKTEQRTFTSAKNGQEPKFETVTRETVETFSGHRSQKVTLSEKRDVLDTAPGDLLASLTQSPSNGVNSRKISKGSSPRGTSRSSSASPDRGCLTPKKFELRNGTSCMKSKFNSSTDFGSGDSIKAEEFAQECWKAHNEYRQQHGVPLLKLNKKMCKHSEDWAKHLAMRGHMEHQQNSIYGENLFCSWCSSPNFKITGREPVDNWYKEVSDHPFGREPRDLKTGHFSQVVWKDSRELGVGVARSRNGQIFVVCNYSPPGNYIGSFAKNVPPVGGFPEGKQQNGTCTETANEDLAKEGLKLHNEYRKKHGVPPLKLSQELSDYASEWASTLAKDDKFGHRPDCKYGENIYCMWSSDLFPLKTVVRDACQNWYKEVKDFAFGTEPRVLKSGHFSQMIWKSSKEFGLGAAISASGRMIVVANYNPRGNYIGQFTLNVPRPL